MSDQTSKKTNREASIVIGHSKIHGRGLFAARPFHRGDLVVSWENAKYLSDAQFSRLPKKEKMFVSWFSRGQYIYHQPPARYINHSCHPNTKIDRRNRGDRAIRNIRTGEEITSNYESEVASGTTIPCRCKQRHCKKTLMV